MQENDCTITGAPLCCSSRLALAILVFFGFLNMYALRMNMSVAIVCMTRQPSYGKSCQNYNTSTKMNMEHCQQNDTNDDKFDWDKKTQGLVLSSFFWGYILIQVAGGWLSGRYGGKHVFGWCMLVCSVSTLLMPVAAQFNVFLLIGLRIVSGLTQSKTTPWRKIFSSLPVWACIVTHVCSDWGSIMFHTNITSYMDDVLGFQINKAGFLSALPYIGVWVTANVSGHLADFLISRQYISTTTARKIFTSITTFLPALFVLLTGYMKHPSAAVTFLTIGVAMSGCQFGSESFVNILDIAPIYAGIIPGIANSMGRVAGILAPLSVGIITGDRTREQWQNIFKITACIYIFGGIFYIIFGSGTIQSWALEKEDTPDIVINTISSANGNTTKKLESLTTSMADKIRSNDDN